ncbi:hypothetical protein OPT61_g1920 [Boeremia exigua]|uniref:Uncharacterized protein n=1 Tax=Boeremia exigua TaxID=749465 RepID=A0ACC2INM9_9PLEO|nr:hypothetical protein OPT61_g1920 [Boeremia exigua]
MAHTDPAPPPAGTQSMPPPELPRLVAEQHQPIPTNDKDSQRLIVVLCNATLETYKASHGSGRGPGGREDKYNLLNSDDHIGVMRKMGRDISEARPDITHQCLLTLLDSPINKAGKLQIYIQTARNVLIRVSPTVRIPRTFKRFAGLMVQLLHRHQIRSTSSQEKLIEVIKNPITDHLPPNCRKVTLSFDAEVVRLSDYIGSLNKNESIAVFVGAMAKGNDDFADAIKDDSIGISNFNLSASVACSKFCHAAEDSTETIGPPSTPKKEEGTKSTGNPGSGKRTLAKIATSTACALLLLILSVCLRGSHASSLPPKMLGSCYKYLPGSASVAILFKANRGVSRVAPAAASGDMQRLGICADLPSIKTTYHKAMCCSNRALDGGVSMQQRGGIGTTVECAPY